MKPIFTRLGLVPVFLLLINCQKTDSNNSTAINYFEVDDQTHYIKEAALIRLEGNPRLDNMKVLLFISDGLSIDANSNWELKIRGKGKLMGFIIYSKKNEGLDNGDHFINLRPPFKEGDIALGFYALNWDENDGLIYYEDDDDPIMLAGKVSVLQKQDLVKLEFNFTTEEGKILSGQYNGPLQKNLIYKTEQIEFDN